MRNLRWGSGVLLACAVFPGCGDDGGSDRTAPEIASVTPAEGTDQVWLHDEFTLEFSEPIDPATVNADNIQLIDADGADLTGEVTLDDDGIIARVHAAETAAAFGNLRLTVSPSVTDVAGNAIAAEQAFSWTLPVWAVAAHDRGDNPQVPGIGLAGDMIVVAWSVGGTEDRRIVVDDGSGNPLGGELGTGSAVLPVVAGDAQGRPVVAWWDVDTMTIEAARWDGADWELLPSPGAGSLPVLAASPAGDVALVWVNIDGDVDAATLEGDDWQPIAGAPIAATTVIGRPAVAMSAGGTVVAAYIEQSSIGTASEQLDVRVVPLGSNSGSADTLVPPITLTAIPTNAFDRVNVAVAGDRIAVAWDEFSGHGFSAHVAELVGGAWSVMPTLDVDPPANATAPDVQFDADGAPIAIWLEQIEGAHRGFAARFDGTAWETIGGDAWTGAPEDAPIRGLIALWRGRVPVVADTEVTASGAVMRLARFNGPASRRFALEALPALAGCGFDIANPPATLSETGCFTITAGAPPVANPGLFAYDLVSELWTDGALKRRWLGLPAGAMTQLANGSLDAPVGSFVIKEFAIGDPAARQPVETRFLARTDAGWTGVNYQWRADGSDADLLEGTASSMVAWTTLGGQSYTHFYPSRTDCTRCHNGTTGQLLGVRRFQLARRFDYGGILDDQLGALERTGLLVPSGATPPVLPAPHDPRQTLEQRVRGYLAANCSHCHNPTGERPTRDFRLETPLASTNLCGVVTPGNPGASVVMTRLSNRPGMPPIGTLQTDPLILDVMADWISSIATCP